MNDFYRKHQDLIIISSLLIVTLFLLLSNLREKSSLNIVERAVLSVFAPFQESVSWGVGKASMVWDDYIYLVDVHEKNKRLKKAADKLSFENNILVERIKLYGRLEKLVTLPRLDETEFEVASVIGRDTTGRALLVTINKGSENGVKENMPVVTHKGLAGRVVRVSSSAAKVLLITDVRSAIDAIVQETRDGLVATGSNLPLLDTRYLAVNAKVKDGDRVISSGFGGTFPKGLLIGILKDAHSVKDSLFKTAKIIPAADLNHLEEVIVLKSRAPETDGVGDMR